MHRPLREPIYLRFWNLIKGVLFYNTVYWQKASDNLNMPSLTRAERERLRPVANSEIIKPREKPRARLDTFRGAQISDPVQEIQEANAADEPGTGEEIPDLEGGATSHRPESGRYVKRRKYKRRRTGGAHGGNGFFRRVFGK